MWQLSWSSSLKSKRLTLHPCGACAGFSHTTHASVFDLRSPSLFLLCRSSCNTKPTRKRHFTTPNTQTCEERRITSQDHNSREDIAVVLLAIYKSVWKSINIKYGSCFTIIICSCSCGREASSSCIMFTWDCGFDELRSSSGRFPSKSFQTS